MIQRIQTIYLLIATGVLIAAMCLPIGTVIEPDYTIGISNICPARTVAVFSTPAI